MATENAASGSAEAAAGGARKRARTDGLQPGLTGFGAAGARVAAALDHGTRGRTPATAGAGDLERLHARTSASCTEPAVADRLALGRCCEAVAECAHPAAFGAIAASPVTATRCPATAPPGTGT